jgi:hypothetical protein
MPRLGSGISFIYDLIVDLLTLDQRSEKARLGDFCQINSLGGRKNPFGSTRVICVKPTMYSLLEIWSWRRAETSIRTAVKQMPLQH